MPRRSWTVALAAALGVASAGGAVALTVQPGRAAAAPNRFCDQTVVVVEWHEAAPDKHLSAQCVDPGNGPFDALKNANLSPITQVESTAGTILCSILNAPASSCDKMPSHAAWTYWYVDPKTHEWQGPYTSPPKSSASMPAPSRASGGPGAATGPQPSTAPRVEDWVYQSDYPAHPVKPAYYVQGNPPSSTPSTTPSSTAGPSTSPVPSGTAAPSAPGTPRGTGPRLPAGVPRRHHSPAERRSSAQSPQPTITSSAPAATSVGQADGFEPPRVTLPQMPAVSPPDQWWIAADQSKDATMTHEGQASRTAWATAAPGDNSAHRLAWSTGLGAAAIVLLGIGITTQFRRRRSG